MIIRNDTFPCMIFSSLAQADRHFSHYVIFRAKALYLWRRKRIYSFLPILHRYCGAKSLSDLKTIVLDSLPISSSMVCQPNSAIGGLLGESKLLFVMILAARFWSFCSWLMSVDPAQPQTEQQYRQWGSTIPV